MNDNVRLFPPAPAPTQEQEADGYLEMCESFQRLVACYGKWLRVAVPNRHDAMLEAEGRSAVLHQLTMLLTKGAGI